MQGQGAATAGPRGNDHGATVTLEEPYGGGVYVPVERLLGTALQERNPVPLLAMGRVGRWFQHLTAYPGRLDIDHGPQARRKHRTNGAADWAQAHGQPQGARAGEQMGKEGAQKTRPPGPAIVVLDVFAADVAQMHVVDIDRAARHAGQARQAAIEVMDRLGVRRAAFFQHRLDQIDAPARAVVFIPGQHIGRTPFGTKTVVNAVFENFGGFGIARFGELAIAEGCFHNPIPVLRQPPRLTA